MAALVWLAILGTDFLLNGGLFAGLYQRSSPFLLAPAELAPRIPLGYLAFAIVALGIVELAHRLGISGWAGGAKLGAICGVGLGSVWSVSLYSVATIDVETASAFFVFWVIVLTVGATVAAFGLAARSLRRLVAWVLAFDIACVVVVVVLQSAGVVPATRL